MGTDAIFNYTIIGDCVNLASRLEAVNQEYRTHTIAGEETWRRAHTQFEARELDCGFRNWDFGIRNWILIEFPLRGARATVS
jgi:class 3 adenylate cyclase